MKHDRCVTAPPGLSPRLKRAGSGAECFAESEKRSRSGKREAVSIAGVRQSPSAAVCDFERRQPQPKVVSLPPQSNGARGRAALTYGREFVAGSRGLQGEGASRKAHLRSTDGQRSDSLGGRTSGARCAVACHAESERQLVPLGRWGSSALSNFRCFQ